jgi:hypothetical protein
LREAGADTSEFGTSAVAEDPSLAPNNFSHAKAVQPPLEPHNSPVDSARSAVETALSGLQVDATPATAELGPGAQALSEPVQIVPPVPVAPAGPHDTPSLVLPVDGAGPIAATPPPPPLPEHTSAAPPPMPPPLMAAPGAVIPNPPQQQR